MASFIKHTLVINSQANREVIKIIITIFPFHVNMFVAVAPVPVLLLQPCLSETASQQTSAMPAFTIFPPFRRCSLSHRCRSCGTDVSIGAGDPRNVDRCLVSSVVFCDWCKDKFL